jgi:hypothetical protein
MPNQFIIAAISQPHPLIILPFGVLLLAIALMPFINGHWWERHYPKDFLGNHNG